MNEVFNVVWQSGVGISLCAMSDRGVAGDCLTSVRVCKQGCRNQWIVPGVWSDVGESIDEPGMAQSTYR